MAFCPVLTDEAQIDKILMAFSPFLLMGSIKADFDGILTPFDFWFPLRQILMAFSPVLTYGAH